MEGTWYSDGSLGHPSIFREPVNIEVSKIKGGEKVDWRGMEWRLKEDCLKYMNGDGSG